MYPLIDGVLVISIVTIFPARYDKFSLCAIYCPAAHICIPFDVPVYDHPLYMSVELPGGLLNLKFLFEGFPL
jgi:hypothetical protein